MNQHSITLSVPDLASTLRAQLAQVAAASQVLERTQDEKQRAYLAAINHNVCKMLRLLTRAELGDLLAGEDEIRSFPKELDLGVWLGGLENTLRRLLAMAQVELTLQTPEHLFTCADRELLRYMVLDMLTACAVPGGKLTLSAGQAGEGVALIVTAAGCNPPREEDLALAGQIALIHGGELTLGNDREAVTLTVTLPPRQSRSNGILESPRANWYPDGFDPVLVGLSELLPAAAFLPEELG